MNSRTYAEVYQIIQYLPEREYCLIPKDTIDFFEKNRDKDFPQIIDISTDLAQVELSSDAITILLSLFDLYIATNEQKVKLRELLSPKDTKASGISYGEMLKNIHMDKNNQLQNNFKDNSIEYQLTIVSKDSLFTRIKKFLQRILKK